MIFRLKIFFGFVVPLIPGSMSVGGVTSPRRNSIEWRQCQLATRQEAVKKQSHCWLTSDDIGLCADVALNVTQTEFLASIFILNVTFWAVLFLLFIFCLSQPSKKGKNGAKMSLGGCFFKKYLHYRTDCLPGINSTAPNVHRRAHIDSH